MKKTIEGTAILLILLLTVTGCDNSLSSDTQTQTQPVQSEDERLDALIGSYLGNIIDFPLEYNQSQLVETGEQRALEDYVDQSDVSYINDILSYANHDFDLYKYGSNINILTDERLDAEYVGRALEILKRREPVMYENLIENPSNFDYTVFSFVDTASEYGDWAAYSHGKSYAYSTTGNHARFILQDRGDIIATNQSSLPPEYKDGLSDDEIYENLMKDKFLTMIIHESLHGVYAHDYPQLFWDNNSDYRARLEHVNIYTIQYETAERLSSTDTYVEWLETVVQLQYDYLIDQGFSEQRMQNVVAYRAF